MKNIRGALFLLSLSFAILFNSTTIAQAKAPTIWVCSPTSSSYTLIKFRSYKSLEQEYRSSTNRISPWGAEEDYNKFKTKILNEKNCKDKIEKQSYKKLYKKLSRDGFKKIAKKKLSGGRTPFHSKEKKILKSELNKLSKKYNEYPLKNLASTTQTQQVAKREWMCVIKRTNNFNWYLKNIKEFSNKCDFTIDSQKHRSEFDLLKSIWLESKGNLSMAEIHKFDVEKILKGTSLISAKKEPKKKAAKKKEKKVVKKEKGLNRQDGLCYKSSEKIYYIKIYKNKCKKGFFWSRDQDEKLLKTLKVNGYTEISKSIAKKEKKIKLINPFAKKGSEAGQDWKCKLFGHCGTQEKTQQVAKKIINIYCVKKNYSAIRIEKGEKPNCKNTEFNVVKNEYLLLETVYDSLASYFDLNDPNEVVLFEQRVMQVFKTAHQDFNKLADAQQIAKIKSTKKSFNIFKKEKKKITTKEVLDLGKYTEFNAYPEGMLKEFKKCKKMHCRGKIAGKKVYEIFARRGELWHQRHPGDIIHGMAWFEIFYLEKLRKNKKQIARYIKNGPNGYSSKMKLRKDVNLLHGLIKTNKGRIKMREALGLSLNDDLETVLKRHWLLGDFLNKDKLKVKKVKINSSIKKRKELLAKYKSALTKYKNKLDEERRAAN